MKKTESKWLLLTLGVSFWIALGLAGPVFKNVLGLNDLSPMIFLVLGLPTWFFAVSSCSRYQAWVGTVGGVVFAGAATSVMLPLHVRAAYWKDACESRDVAACLNLAEYHREGYSFIGGFVDAVHYEEMANRWRGKTDKTRDVPPTTIKSACLNSHDLGACSQWVDRGYYPESKVACDKILRLCRNENCEQDVFRCELIVEPWPYSSEY